MFVGDVHFGNIYHFDLTEARTELSLGGLLIDKVADSDSELEEAASGGSSIIFGKDFGGITDLEVGPDGYLYVVSIGHGAIYRIVPNSSNDELTIDKDGEQDDDDDIELEGGDDDE
jgi:aldose sugar dehydrogenase